MARNKNVWTKEALEEAVKNNETISGVLRDLGFRIQAGHFQTFRLKVASFGLNTDHFTGRGARNGGHRMAMDAVLVENSTYRGALKQRLLAEGLMADVCSICGITDWQGSPISLHVDHINGVSTDNRIGNLRLVCPNCHSQTATYAGRNRDRYAVKCVACNAPTDRSSNLCRQCGQCHGHTFLTRLTSQCDTCHKEICFGGKQCQTCYDANRKTKIQWPEPVALQARVEASTCVQVAKELGVSGQAVRKFLRKNGLDIPHAKAHRGRKKK